MYGLIGKITAVASRRDALASILIEGTAGEQQFRYGLDVVLAGLQKRLHSTNAEQSRRPGA